MEVDIKYEKPVSENDNDEHNYWRLINKTQKIKLDIFVKTLFWRPGTVHRGVSP